MESQKIAEQVVDDWANDQVGDTSGTRRLLKARIAAALDAAIQEKDEVQRRMDAVVEAAVAWHQSRQEGSLDWAKKADELAVALDALLELRATKGEKETNHA